jgi:hypothetical protein
LKIAFPETKVWHHKLFERLHKVAEQSYFLIQSDLKVEDFGGGDKAGGIRGFIVNSKIKGSEKACIAYKDIKHPQAYLMPPLTQVQSYGSIRV